MLLNQIFSASSASAVGPAFVNVCSQVAPATAIILFAAPIPTILKVSKEKEVRSLPMLPYTTMSAASVLWTTYGILKNSSAIWVPNGMGLLLSLYYLLQYTKAAPASSPTIPGPTSTHIQFLVAVAAVVVASIGVLKNPAERIGMSAVLFSVAMFASPLSALKTVLQTKSAESIPLPFSMMSVLNCSLWSIAGYWKMQDVNIIIPNVLGLLCGCLQLLLKFAFRKSEKQAYALATP